MNRRKENGSRQFRKLGIGNTPYFHRIQIRINDIFQMSSHSRTIGRWARTGCTYSLGDIEDDTCEPIFIQVDFLMVGNLSYCAVMVVSWGS